MGKSVLQMKTTLKFGNSDENGNGQCQLQCLLTVKRWPNRKSHQIFKKISAVTGRLRIGRCSMRIFSRSL